MLSTLVPSAFEGTLSDARKQATARFAEMRDETEAVDFYDSNLFPLSCQHFIEKQVEFRDFELAFVPVGTQPYSPILAALSVAATTVILLATFGSIETARQVQALLQGIGRGSTILMIGNGLDQVPIADAISVALRDYRIPSASNVIFDVTSGYRVTPAILAAMAGRYGTSLNYVYSEPSAHSGKFVHERAIVIDKVHEFEPYYLREELLTLAQRGYHFEALKKAEMAALQGNPEVNKEVLASLNALYQWYEFKWDELRQSLLTIAESNPRRGEVLKPLIDELEGWEQKRADYEPYWARIYQVRIQRSGYFLAASALEIPDILPELPNSILTNQPIMSALLLDF